MKKKILMINPPTGLLIRDDRCQSNINEFMVSVSRPPQELLIMAAILKKDGHETIIQDYPIEKKTLVDYEKDIRKFWPDILVINATIPTITDDAKCVRAAKKIKQDLVVMLRCGMIEHIAQEVMAQEELIDVIFYGESDFTLHEFLECKDKNEVKGIFYRNKKRIVKTEPRPFIANLDSLPMIDRNLIRNELYKRPDTGAPLGLIEVSRGCPYSCIFCLTPFSYGRHHRRRSIQNIIKEIIICKRNYGIFDFHFKSDLFSFDKKWIIGLCREITKNNLGIRWFANSRADTVDAESLEAMKESGCFALSLGAESGSQYILDKIRKDITKKQIKKAFELCERKGIQTYAYFIIGFPWDTKDTIEETIRFSKIIDPDYIDFFFPYAFKGTGLSQIIARYGLLNKVSTANTIRKSYIGLQFPTLTLGPKELIRLRKKALRSFYLRPAYILKSFKRFSSFQERMNILKYGISLLKKIMR